MLKKKFEYRLGYLAGTLAAWRKRFTLKYMLGYLAGMLGF